MAIRVLLVDDHKLLAQAVAALLRLEPDIEIVDTVYTGSAALAGLAQRPDMLLLDLHLPDMDGVDLIRHVLASPATAHVRILMLTSEVGPSYVDLAMRAGAHGYLLKSVDSSTVAHAIRVIMSGDTVLVPHMPHATGKATTVTLTLREQTILDLITQGKSTKEIAGLLGLSPHTIRNQTAGLFDKLGVTNRTEAAAQALRTK